MAGIPGLFGFFMGWVGSASEPQPVPTHTLAVTVFGPSRATQVESAGRAITVTSGKKIHYDTD